MTLIKCPKCDHTVLSAASRCPQCGSFMDPVQRDAIRVNRPHRLWPIIVGLGVVGLVVVGMWRAQSERAGAIAMSTDPPVTEASPRLEPIPDTVIATSVPSRARPAPRRDTATARPARAQDPPPAETDTLWTRTWVNVRERPGTTSTVVQVLTPGKPVAVVNPERQWSLVYVDGRRVGYLSVAMLAPQPPTP